MISGLRFLHRGDHVAQAKDSGVVRDLPERHRLMSPRSLADVAFAPPFERTYAQRLEATPTLSPRSPVITESGSLGIILI